MKKYLIIALISISNLSYAEFGADSVVAQDLTIEEVKGGSTMSDDLIARAEEPTLQNQGEMAQQDIDIGEKEGVLGELNLIEINQ
jgi:hypothetical protein